MAERNNSVWGHCELDFVDRTTVQVSEPFIYLRISKLHLQQEFTDFTFPFAISTILQLKMYTRLYGSIVIKPNIKVAIYQSIFSHKKLYNLYYNSEVCVGVCFSARFI